MTQMTQMTQMLEEIKLQQCLTQVLPRLLLPPLVKIVLTYCNCEFEGALSSSQMIDEESLEDVFCTPAGQLVIRTHKTVADEKTTWIILPTTPIAPPSPKSNPKTKSKSNVPWRYAKELDLMERKDKQEVLVEDSLGRTLRFYVESKKGIWLPDCWWCHGKDQEAKKSCYSCDHQQMIQTRKVEEFDSKSLLDLELVTTTCFDTVWIPRGFGDSNVQLRFQFWRSPCDPTLSHLIYHGINKGKIREEKYLFVSRSRVCKLTDNLHSRELDSWLSTEENSFAFSKDGLFLGVALFHIKWSGSGLPGDSKRTAAFQQHVPCQVVWWKRESLEEEFRLQPAICLNCFLDIDQDSNYQCCLAFTRSKSHLVIALSTSKTQVQLLFFNLAQQSVVRTQQLTFPKTFPKTIPKSPDRIRMCLGYCTEQRIQVLICFLPECMTRRERNLPTNRRKQFLLLNLVFVMEE